MKDTKHTISPKHAAQQFAQFGGLLGVGLEQAPQELGRQAIPQDALGEQANGTDVDPGTKSLQGSHLQV